MNGENLYLIGMMGSGKSVTGRKLAVEIGYSFVDLDELIEKAEGNTIGEIFLNKGESWFRSCESAALKQVSGRTKQVVATGGGVILLPENIRLMRQTGKTVFLKTSLPWLLRRLEGFSHRPLISGGDWKKKAEELLAVRSALYEQAGDLAVSTDQKDPADVAHEIAVLIEQETK